jgi:hypothetical protein
MQLAVADTAAIPEAAARLVLGPTAIPAGRHWKTS